ncbi:unnamed protein product [Vitrella brassicaformis CCMP3155]|uniref:TauD/TfdA-like domain-containing protein n=1 Tax=Vitrella brassicaformis (strain CCMP3155) TaxID=1169540 RepID=A0A0G4G730_VITBC|nr:unnamed protein product [Vitrella brassicaformis CCMP3155]|eukprot:CEM24473.1 unnamed protein product [Vitrella brassicaformis CCMP3155]
MEVETISIPEQRKGLSEEHSFPLTLKPREGELKTIADVKAWLTTNRQGIFQRLTTHGALLFRSFPISSPEDFAEFVLALGRENFPYIGGNAVRRNIVGDIVFTANESPPSEKIPWHHEMAQLPAYPSKLLFYCDLPSAEGGETPIVLSHAVYRRIKDKYPDFLSKLEEKGVKYVRVAPEEDDELSALGRSWKSTFRVATREEAEAKMKEDGYTWEWLAGGDLKTITPMLSAVKAHPEKGDETEFFNQMIAAFTGWKDKRNDPQKAVLFGDGEPLPSEVMNFIAQVADEEAVAFKWHKGDVLLVDNYAVMHARRSFVPPRRILASLVK